MSSYSGKKLTKIKTKWKYIPAQNLYLIGKLFCEKYSYHAVKTILLLYLRDSLMWDDNTSTVGFYFFVTLTFFFPLFGTIMANSFLGSYRSFYVYLIFCIVGSWLLFFSSIPYLSYHHNRTNSSIVGLFLLAVGFGGTKPIESRFGEEQFKSGQVESQRIYITFMYKLLNAGAILGCIVTPILRSNVGCLDGFSEESVGDCFSLAFAIPAGMAVLAFCLFAIGAKSYTVKPPTGSKVVVFFKCVYSALINKLKTPKLLRKKSHWLDYAQYSPQIISDVQKILKMLILFIPLPIFWGLYEQQGSKWVLQAIETNGYVGKAFLKPDHLGASNAFLIVLLIPLMKKTLFPCLKRFKIPFPPLRRILVGLFLTGVSFLMAGIVQGEIEKNSTSLPNSNEYGIRYVNALPCEVTIQSGDQTVLQPYTASNITIFSYLDEGRYCYTDCYNSSTIVTLTPTSHRAVYDAVIHVHENESSLFSKVLHVKMNTKKSHNGKGRISVLNLNEETPNISVAFFSFKNKKLIGSKITAEYGRRSYYVDAVRGKIEAKLFDPSQPEPTEIYTVFMEVGVGGVYSIYFHQHKTFWTEDVNPNQVHIAWLFPQFVIITISEILITISGLTYSYTKIAPEMRSVMATFWVLSVSIGNLIFLILSSLTIFSSKMMEFFFNAILAFICAGTFSRIIHNWDIPPPITPEASDESRI